MYIEHYGLTGRPFQLSPDPAFYFDSQTHRKAMAYLGYGLAQGEGAIVITGDRGTGKTTLVGHLMATIDRARLTAVRLVPDEAEGGDMARLVARQLGLAAETEKAPLLDRLERHLRAEAAGGKRTLLIVDEAQNLPVSALEELRMLSGFQAGGQALAQIFLLGQPEFRERLETAGLEQLRQRVIATHHLEPMRAEEVGPYIEHRLSRVGWRGDPAFTPDAFAALHRHAGGVPRALNALASRLLLLGAMEGRAMLDEAAVESAVRDISAEPPSAPAEAEPVEHAPADTGMEKVAARIVALEARVEEQEVALRRVLTLLIDWVESDSAYAPGSSARHDAA